LLSQDDIESLRKSRFILRQDGHDNGDLGRSPNNNNSGQAAGFTSCYKDLNKSLPAKKKDCQKRPKADENCAGTFNQPPIIMLGHVYFSTRSTKEISLVEKIAQKMSGTSTAWGEGLPFRFDESIRLTKP